MSLDEAVLLNAESKLKERYPKLSIRYKKTSKGYQYTAETMEGIIYAFYEWERFDALTNLELLLDSIRAA